MLKLNIEDAIKTLKETEFPQDVIFETTTTCNLKCIMCPQSQVKRKGQIMDFSIFKKGADEIVSEFPETRIWFAQMGEALIDVNNLLKKIRYAKSIGLNNLHLNTNGGLLTQEISNKLIRSGISNIYFGIDACNAETYSKIRCNGDFEKTVNEINEFIIINKAEGSPVKIAVQYIVMDENAAQLETFIDYWIERGVNVKIRPRIGWGDAYRSNQLYLKEDERNYPCPWIIRVMQVYVDGTVVQCGGDWDCQYKIANIKDRSLKSIWNGELKLIRKRHWELDFSQQPCCECKDWQSGRSYYRYPNEV